MTGTSLQILFYGMVFIATVLLIEGAAGLVRGARREKRRINRRLNLIDSGLDRAEVLSLLRRDRRVGETIGGPVGAVVSRIERTLSQAGFSLPVSRFLLIMAASGLGLLVLALLLSYSLVGKLSAGGIFLSLLLAAATGLGLPLVVLGRLRDRRLKKLEQQFPLALDVFVRGLRAGHPISAALALLAEESPDPIGSEFGIVHDEMTYGLELRDALQNMAERCGLADMHMFTVSISVQNETGGNLAEILENLTRVIRDRAAMVLKVRALSSEGRMTAAMLTILPVFAFVVLFLVNPAFYLDVADDPAFFPAAFALLGLYGIGVFVIRRMIDLKV